MWSTATESNYTLSCNYSNRSARPSVSSSASSGSGTTSLTFPDSNSDAASEPDSLFVRDNYAEADTIVSNPDTIASEPLTWGSGSTDSGDHSINSVPSLPVDSEFGDSEGDRRYIPHLNNLAESRIVDHDPAPGTQSHLPCPFRSDGCEVRFDIAEKKKWIHHSVVHFGRVMPPRHLICPYGDCPERFANKNGMVNWRNRMEHYAGHVEEKLAQLHGTVGWAADDDLDMVGLGMLNMPEQVDINFQQYMIHHGANRVGLDSQINPRPPSELDNIPRGYMNQMPPEYGGPRFREVVFNSPVEKNLDSRSAGTMFVRDSRRTGEAVVVLTARTSRESFKSSQRQVSRAYKGNDRREASESIIRK